MSKNVVFIVDIEEPHVRSVKSLLADNLGVWKGTGTKTFYFRELTKSNPPTKVSEVMFYIYEVSSWV